jgi:hypothetical protein
MENMRQIDEELVTTFGDSELDCQYDHTNRVVPDRLRMCEHEVTHIVVSSCGRDQILLCSSAALSVEIVIAAGRVVVCKVCKQPTATHWRMRPV